MQEGAIGMDAEGVRPVGVESIKEFRRRRKKGGFTRRRKCSGWWKCKTSGCSRCKRSEFRSRRTEGGFRRRHKQCVCLGGRA